MPDYCDITVTVPSSHEQEAIEALMDMHVLSETPAYMVMPGEISFSIGEVNVNNVAAIGANFVDLKIPASIAAHNFDDQDSEDYLIQSVCTGDKWALIELTRTEQTQLELIRQVENQLDQCQDLQQLKTWLNDQIQHIISPKALTDA